MTTSTQTPADAPRRDDQESPDAHPVSPRYTLRRTRRAWMIDRLVTDLSFPDDWWFRERSYGPFPSREPARQFMLRHEGRP